jgi:hypothetical protein
MIFESPPFETRKDTSAKVFGPGIDLLTNGCLIVAPPSRHISGQGYTWESGLSLLEMKPAVLPPTWLNHLRRSNSRHAADKPGAANSNRIFVEGERNNQLTSLAGRYRSMDVPLAIILSRLEEINATRCKPPLGQAEIENIVRSIGRYTPQFRR